MNLISKEDDLNTNSKLEEMKHIKNVMTGITFCLMTAIYKYTNGFACSWPWYFKYSRHIFCIASGTLILPKYIIGN